MRRRVLVLVEGQTEEIFVNQTLVPHLGLLGLDVSCTRVCTAREQQRRTFRGGVTSYPRISKDVSGLLLSKPHAVTCLFDVYAFPTDLPGYPDPWPPTGPQRAAALAAAIEKDIGDPRFFAGLCVHEFEGLLFTDPAKLAATIEPDPVRLMKLAGQLAAIRATVASPEDLNDGRETAPSKRLAPFGYDKTRHGPSAAARIGLAQLRAACPLFDGWLTKFEGLAP